MDPVDNQEKKSSQPQTQDTMEPVQHEENPTKEIVNPDENQSLESTEPIKEELEEEHNELLDTKPLLKIKEIKYGMTVLINTGNFENIRTHIEVTAEVENEVTEQNHLKDYIGVLREQVFQVGRNEYREVKLKNKKKTTQ